MLDRLDRRLVARLVSLVVVLTTGALLSPAAYADFGITPGSYSAGVSSIQAGAHPDLTTSFAFNTHPDAEFGALPDENIRDIIVKLPPGIVGNAQAYPTCPSSFLALRRFCPTDTQVGVIAYELAGAAGTLYAPVYNIAPTSNRPAEFGFLNLIAGRVQVHILPSIRTGEDYGITATVPVVPGNLRLLDSSVTLWGVPADASHNDMRGSIFAGGCLGPFGPTGDSCPSSAPQRPFLSNPTRCDGPSSIALLIDSWEHAGSFLSPLLAAPQQFTGCDKLVFEPSLSLQPATRAAAAPSAYEADLHVPQTDAPTALATPHLRKAVVTLPEGVTISPSAADGLVGCSDAQIAIDSAADPSCPDAAKIGSVKVITPLLPDPLEGAIYQGTQTPEHLVRIFIVARGHGVLVKLPGSIDLDPATGQITTTFDNNPQLPFTDFILRFKGGPRAPLSNPRTCGVKTTTATLTSWAGNVVTTTDSFDISSDGNGAPCAPYGFSPSFRAGTESPVAGRSSSFTVSFARADSDQLLKGITVTPPPGLLAKVRGVPLCGEADASAGTCGDGSLIGSVRTSAGPGSRPFSLTGRVYLTGPYHGKPYGLSIVVPAKAGPLDLGNVIVRASIDVRDDGSLSVVSDPLPTILQGIPLQVRAVQVTIDRKNFMVNPTNCGALKVGATISSLEGASASVSSPFRLLGCGRLPFRPRMVISVGRAGHTNAGASVPLTATLTQTPGQAALKTVSVSLPGVLTSHLEVLNHACTRAEFDAGACSTKARAGFATAVTPLLNKPVRGAVYFVKRTGAKPGALPDLVVALRGEVDINLVGTVKLPHNGALIQTTFKTVPDVPISRFSLHLVDGSHGPVGASSDLCTAKARRARVGIVFHGQNGKSIRSRQPLKIHGC